MTNPVTPHKLNEQVELEEQPEDGSAPLQNPRHELYAQFRGLTGCTVQEAYRQAGGKQGANAQKQGTKFGARAEVKLRISWLKSHQADRIIDEAVMGRREILEELKTNMTIGRNVKGGLNASNRALELIGGEEHDMFVVRKENRNKKIDELDGLDPEQLVAYIAKAAARIPGLELDAEALALACGFERPEITSGRPAGDREASTGSEVSESESL
jgi:hypothetical protein